MLCGDPPAARAAAGTIPGASLAGVAAQARHRGGSSPAAEGLNRDRGKSGEFAAFGMTGPAVGGKSGACACLAPLEQLVGPDSLELIESYAKQLEPGARARYRQRIAELVAGDRGMPPAVLREPL